MTLNGRDWTSVVDSLASEWDPVTIDLIGHGRSEAPDSPKDYRTGAVVDQLKGVVDQLDLAPVRWVGYSLGGRVLLQLAVRHPELVDSMILESTTAGIESEAEREKRRRKDEKLAEFLELQGLNNFVDRWMSAPIFESQQSVCVQKRQQARQLRLENDPIGLQHCLRELGRGSMPHVWDRLEELTMPVQLITGDQDPKHCEIHERLLKKLPDASDTVINNAGHNVHFEQPEAFVEACVKFLAV